MQGDLLQLAYFGVHVGNKEIEDVTMKEILEWFERMREFSFDIETIGKKATVLRNFFDFYKKSGYSVLEPMLIPVPPRRHKIPRVAKEEDFNMILDVIQSETKRRSKGAMRSNHVRNKAMVLMLWDTGARIGEICALDIGDIDLEKKKAIIQTEKSRGTRPIRELFWTEKTNKALKSWMVQRKLIVGRMAVQEPSALFLSVKGGRPKDTARGKRTSASAFGEILRKYSNKAGLPINFNAHSMRHHMGHHIIQKGGSNADVMNVLGHASVQSTTPYTMMQDKELEKRYRKFNGE